MENNNGRSSAFLNGFLWGVVLGAGVVFFFGTKKGKKILRNISEQGSEVFSGLEDYIEEEEDDYDPTAHSAGSGQAVSGQEEDFEGSKPQSKSVHKESSNGEAKPQAQSLLEKTKTTGKRFFKGIRKKG